MALRIVPVRPDTVPLWRDVHDLVIPAHQLSLDEVGVRSQRNRLTLAHDGGTLIGNADLCLAS
ncbi:hypothetical protein ACQP2P_20120 [Dactylosporangium sp. CA-139114]|uniref:hypothetical protein n=1 Tax=Dactylosporangium sp. CA-139114 TaxID=3239931 RepID=UPI003D95DA1A